MKLAKALYANTADTDEELTFKVGDILTVLEQDVEGLEGWWICSLGQRTGIAPGNRLKLLATNENHVHLQNNRSSKEVAGTSSSRHHSSTNRQSNSLNAKSINELQIPRKSGNVYIYDTPPSGTQTNRLQLDEAYLQQQPDYDIPSRNSQQDYDVPPPLTDVPVMLSPDSAGGYVTSSNRSSMISVQSTGSHGSVTSSRLEHPDFRSVRDSVLDDYDVPRSDVTEEESTSADSGVYCGTGVSGMKMMKLHCDVTPAPDPTNQDYDVPEMYVTRVQNGGTDNLTSTPSSTGKAVVNNSFQQVDVKLLEQYDVVTKNLARLRQYLNVINNSSTHEAVTVERQWSGQVKLAGLSVKTAMQELVDSYNNHRQVQNLRSSLAELNHLLECFTASPSSRPSTATNRLPQHITMTSPVLLDETARTSLEAIKRLVELLPVQLEHFVLEVSDGSQTKSETPAKVTTASSSSPSCHKRQTTTSQQKSPAPLLSNSRKPPPPPTKPKPPKQQVSTLKRPNQPPVTAQQEASCNKTKPASSETENSWSAHDLDYADIAEQAEREMTKASPTANTTSAALPPRPPSTSNKPPVAKKPDVLPRSSSLAANSKQQQLPLQLCDADQELIEFYALQVDAHNTVVQTAAQNFFQSMASDSMTSLPPEVLVRRSRLVVLAGHKLVYLGDALARHVTDIRVRDYVAFVANQLCDKLKSVVLATKQAALADISDIVSTRQMMLQSVDIAVRECLELGTNIRNCNTAIITA